MRNVFFIFFHFTIFRNYLEKKSEMKVIAKTKEIAKAKTIENKEAKIIANCEIWVKIYGGESVEKGQIFSK